MAIGRLSVGIGKKGKASPHAQYIAREGKYAKPSYHEEKLENTGYGNMPKWAENDPNYLWQMADEHERKNIQEFVYFNKKNRSREWEKEQELFYMHCHL